MRHPMPVLPRLRCGARHRGEHMLAVGLDGTEAFALEPGVGQQAPQPRQRMLDHALPRRLERLVALEDPQAAVRLQHAACHCERARERVALRCRMIQHERAKGRTGARCVRLARASGSPELSSTAALQPATLGKGARRLRRAARMCERRHRAAVLAPQHSSNSGCATPTTRAGPWRRGQLRAEKPGQGAPEPRLAAAAARSGTSAARAALRSRHSVASPRSSCASRPATKLAASCAPATGSAPTGPGAAAR